MRIGAAFIILMLFGCAGPKGFDYEYWALKSTPNIFNSNKIWAFVLLDLDGNIQNTITLEFTDENVETCSNGESFRINILDQPPPQSPNNMAEPAYSIRGAALIIDLSANLCDNGYEIAGSINDLGISGVHYPVTMFGGEVQGIFYGIPVKAPNKAL